VHAVSREFGRAGGAEAAIRDPRFLRNYTREVLQSRAILEKGSSASARAIYPSSANFVLVDFGPASAPPRKRTRTEGNSRARAAGFSARRFLRISVGTRADTRKLLRAMEGIL
jgi:histidinol-phosphate/aromatic aminotransferase/cobyric acid decarboxylase-like protein